MSSAKLDTLRARLHMSGEKLVTLRARLHMSGAKLDMLEVRHKMKMGFGKPQIHFWADIIRLGSLCEGVVAFYF